jgi:hypothetical protein
MERLADVPNVKLSSRQGRDPLFNSFVGGLVDPGLRLAFAGMTRFAFGG